MYPPPPPPPPAPKTGHSIWLIAGGTAALTVAVVAGAALYAGQGSPPGSGPDKAAGSAASASASGPASLPPSAPAAVPSVSGALPSDAPSSLPSLLARPVVRPAQAFPEKTVRLADGSVHDRVEVRTTTECDRAMSQQLAGVLAQGSGCLQLTSALFTDAERRSQVTVGVLSLKRAEDAALVFGMASMDPVTYQVVSLDPPPEAGLPTVPPGSAGVFRRLMTVRSVVFANGQWSDGSESREAAITKQTEQLLSYVNEKVATYEQGKGQG